MIIRTNIYLLCKYEDTDSSSVYELRGWVNKLYNSSDVSTFQSQFIKWINEYDLAIIRVDLENKGLFTDEETNSGQTTGFTLFENNHDKIKVPIVFWCFDENNVLEFKKLKERYPNHRMSYLLKNNDKSHLREEVIDRLFPCT